MDVYDYAEYTREESLGRVEYPPSRLSFSLSRSSTLIQVYGRV